MAEIDLKKLEWGHVEDWSMLIATTKNGWGTIKIGYIDMDNFIEYTIKDISRKTGLNYEMVRSIIRIENEAVLRYIKSLRNYCYCEGDEEIIKFKKMLIIPKVDYSADNIAEMYKRLSNEEKERFNTLIKE